MIITDLNGDEVEIIHLPLALKMAAYYSQFQHADPWLAASDTSLQAYWTDIHAKLTKLQADACCGRYTQSTPMEIPETRG